MLAAASAWWLAAFGIINDRGEVCCLRLPCVRLFSVYVTEQFSFPYIAPLKIFTLCCLPLIFFWLNINWIHAIVFCSSVLY